MKFSMSNDSCQESVESLSRSSKLSNIFRNNFVLRIVRNQLQKNEKIASRLNHIEREEQFEKQKEEGLKTKIEKIQLEISQAEERLQVAELKLRNVKERFNMFREGSHAELDRNKNPIGLQLKRGIDTAKARLLEAQKYLQTLQKTGEKERLLLQSMRDQAEESLRRVERDKARAEQELISAKVDLGVAKRQFCCITKK